MKLVASLFLCAVARFILLFEFPSVWVRPLLTIIVITFAFYSSPANESWGASDSNEPHNLLMGMSDSRQHECKSMASPSPVGAALHLCVCPILIFLTASHSWFGLPLDFSYPHLVMSNRKGFSAGGFMVFDRQFLIKTVATLSGRGKIKPGHF